MKLAVLTLCSTLFLALLFILAHSWHPNPVIEPPPPKPVHYREYWPELGGVLILYADGTGKILPYNGPDADSQ